jgi:hypothetical protein
MATCHPFLPIFRQRSVGTGEERQAPPQRMGDTASRQSSQPLRRPFIEVMVLFVVVVLLIIVFVLFVVVVADAIPI